VRALLAVLLAAEVAAPPKPRAPAVFGSAVDLVYVNVVVRDKNGVPVRDLKREDFIVTEDGKAQTVDTFEREDILVEAGVSPAAPTTVPLLAPAPKADTSGTTAAPATEPRSVEDLAGRRLVVLLFDSLESDQSERALEAARKYVETGMSAADLVAVAQVQTGLKVLQEFTSDREKVQLGLDKIQGIDAASLAGGDTPAADASTAPEETDDAAAPAPAAEALQASLEASEMAMFGIDQRLRAIETLADTLAPLRQKKSVIYFTSGMNGTSVDNQVELRSAIDRAVKANVSIYPVDTRGLEAVIPGGNATSRGSFNAAAFSGQGAMDAFDRQSASQDTLNSLASDTGGKPFLDTNDFSGVFDRVQKDTSSYYVLGYASTNIRKDGKFRHISVKVKRADLKVEHRSGYYADKDWKHLNKDDKERRLQDQLLTDLSATDLPVWLRTSYFRAEEADRYNVAVSVAIPGSAVPLKRDGETDRASLELLGVVRDEADRPVARVRDAIKVAVKATDDVRKKNVQYQTVLTVPPGRYKLKVVLLENQDGTMGTFETEVFVPDLRQAPIKLSSVVLGTQLQPAKSGNLSPLASEGTELVPSLNHVVAGARPVYFYYEVYDPAKAPGGGVKVMTSLAFYNGKERLYETPTVELTKLSASDRKAAIFQFAVPAGSLKPGYYVCQVNIVDDVAGAVSFPRVPLLVK
jgi:VWFA-related protein